MSTVSTINGKPYYYSFDVSCVPSLYDFIHKNDSASASAADSDSDSDLDLDTVCKCYDACVKCKVVEVSNNKNDWVDSPYAFFNNQTKDYKHKYFLVNYDKKILQSRIDGGVEYGYEQYVRSVILNADRRIVCFSPPMCQPNPKSKITQSKEYCGSGSDSDADAYVDVSKVKFAEEFVEGTMINLFYNPSNDVQSWEFSTRNTVSPAEKRENESGVVDKKCFRRMFLEACVATGLKFDDLPKEYSYSFVLQHPDNTIVAPVKSMALYIVAIYYIDGTTVYEMDRSILKWSTFSSVRHPARFGFNGEEDFKKIVAAWASSSSIYYFPGVMFRTHDGARYKYRNPNYEYAKNARGQTDKNRFVYLHLKKIAAFNRHLERYPEDEFTFLQYQMELYNYAHNLHKNYMECYIYKKKPLKEFAVEYRKNMYQLHEYYKTTLKTSGKRVNMTVVIGFMNEQSLSSQLFVLKKFEQAVNMHSCNNDNEEVTMTPEKQVSSDKVVQCPGAPLKENKQ
jgi:hypothetical protein